MRQLPHGASVQRSDRDRDGMPDAWERANDLNPEDPNNGDSYTNLEEYVSSLCPDPLVR